MINNFCFFLFSKAQGRMRIGPPFLGQSKLPHSFKIRIPLCRHRVVAANLIKLVGYFVVRLIKLPKLLICKIGGFYWIGRLDPAWLGFNVYYAGTAAYSVAD